MLNFFIAAHLFLFQTGGSPLGGDSPDNYDKVANTDGLMPGVAAVYETTSSSARPMIMALHNKMTLAAWSLLFGLLVISFLLVQVGVMTKLKIGVQEVLICAFLAVGCLGGYDFIYGMVMWTGRELGEQIADPSQIQEEIRKLNEDAKRVQEGTTSGNAGANVISLFAQTLWAGTGGLLSGLVIALCIIMMFIGSLFINTIWLVFAIGLYVFGPISVMLGVIPRVGAKIVGAWFGAICQLSAWQIWMAICWWFVTVSGKLFMQELSGSESLSRQVTTSFESAAFALVFAFMYMSTPFIVQGLLPISRFSMMAGIAMAAAEKKAGSIKDAASGPAKKVASEIKKSVSGAGGGGAGKTGKESAGAGGSGAGGGKSGAAASGGGGAAAKAGGGAAAAGAGASVATAGAAAPVAVAAVAVAAAKQIKGGIDDQAKNSGE